MFIPLVVEFFSNQGGSADWDEFADWLGETIKLEGWKNFAGGLDTKTNTTGQQPLTP